MTRIVVDIEKRLRADRREFHLRIAFSSDTDVTVLYGNSGAGKSLTMQSIAGLIRPDAGHIQVGERVLFDAVKSIDVPARERNVGFVFQDYALFPHLTVLQNVAFGVSRGWSNPPIASESIRDILSSMHLDALADAYPADLSGGQRQRVALARALACRPQLLLLDEPFSALDSELRHRLRSELIEARQRARIPMIVITHDADDVAAFAGTLIQIADGRVAEPLAG